MCENDSVRVQFTVEELVISAALPLEADHTASRPGFNCEAHNAPRYQISAQSVYGDSAIWLGPFSGPFLSLFLTVA